MGRGQSHPPPAHVLEETAHGAVLIAEEALRGDKASVCAAGKDGREYGGARLQPGLRVPRSSSCPTSAWGSGPQWQWAWETSRQLQEVEPRGGKGTEDAREPPGFRKGLVSVELFPADHRGPLKVQLHLADSGAHVGPCLAPFRPLPHMALSCSVCQRSPPGGPFRTCDEMDVHRDSARALVRIRGSTAPSPGPALSHLGAGLPTISVLCLQQPAPPRPLTGPHGCASSGGARLLALSARGRLMTCSLDLSSEMPCPTRAAMADTGQKIKELLSGIGTVSER